MSRFGQKLMIAFVLCCVTIYATFYTASPAVADVRPTAFVQTCTTSGSAIKWDFASPVSQVYLEQWSLERTQWINVFDLGATPTGTTQNLIRDNQSALQLLPGSLYRVTACHRNECSSSLTLWSPYFACTEDHTIEAYFKASEPVPIVVDGRSGHLGGSVPQQDPRYLIEYNTNLALQVLQSFPDPQASEFQMAKPTLWPVPQRDFAASISSRGVSSLRV